MSTGASTTRYTSRGDVEATYEREFAAPRELLWAAHTMPEHLREWMLGPEGWEMAVCDMDLRPGGALRVVWRRDSGTEMEITGEYVEVDPPSRLVHTESWGPEWPTNVETLELHELPGGRTRLVQTLLFPDSAARDAAMATGMDDGVSLSHDRLDELLSRLS